MASSQLSRASGWPVLKKGEEERREVAKREREGEEGKGSALALGAGHVADTSLGFSLFMASVFFQLPPYDCLVAAAAVPTDTKWSRGGGGEKEGKIYSK